MSKQDIPLRLTVTAAIAALFDPKDQETVTEMLTEDLNAEHLYTSSEDLVERVQLAVLRISKGQVDKFLSAAEIAQLDWRDALMAAGFGEDIKAHLKWVEEFNK